MVLTNQTDQAASVDIAVSEDNVMSDPKIEELFKAGAHVGYSKSRRHPQMNKFIFCTRNNIEIIDLEKTVERLKIAEEFVKSLGKEGKVVFWVGTKPQAREHVEKIGKQLGAPRAVERWIGGTLTNFKVISDRLVYWAKLEEEEKSGGFAKYAKKERFVKMIELRRLERVFGGIKNLKSIPSALVIVDPKEEQTAFSEAVIKNIPIVALLNVDCDPANIQYPIPCNDSSSSVISVILNKLAAAYEEGLREKSNS